MAKTKRERTSKDKQLNSQCAKKKIKKEGEPSSSSEKREELVDDAEFLDPSNEEPVDV